MVTVTLYAAYIAVYIGGCFFDRYITIGFGPPLAVTVLRNIYNVYVYVAEYEFVLLGRNRSH
jgi:hypothetical protein